MTHKPNSIFEAARAVLSEGSKADALRKEGGGAYISSLDIENYDRVFQAEVAKFLKKNNLTNKEAAVVHEESFDDYEAYEAFRKKLDKAKIAYNEFSDKANHTVMIIMSLK